ncbi:hypothetical protein KBY25_22110 [Ruegeria pomeroyi]|nr:hypothetical protein [Ruegeria pomeroyi]
MPDPLSITSIHTLPLSPASVPRSATNSLGIAPCCTRSKQVPNLPAW